MGKLQLLLLLLLQLQLTDIQALTELDYKVLIGMAGEYCQGMRQLKASSGVGSRQTAYGVWTHSHVANVHWLSEPWLRCYSAFLVPLSLFLAIATPADLFLIHHHLWSSRGGPQTCSFGSSPRNNSNFVQELICKVLSYGRIFPQIFILLWYCSGTFPPNLPLVP